MGTDIAVTQHIISTQKEIWDLLPWMSPAIMTGERMVPEKERKNDNAISGMSIDAAMRRYAMLCAITQTMDISVVLLPLPCHDFIIYLFFFLSTTSSSLRLVSLVPHPKRL